ncbi:O-antigen ligase family protein [Alkalibacillus filiformis]|uniref:O-antigen ligase family protein n=1 Tax=Alkalibacillus filiformis TaxID=200990 RepID=UPI0027D8E3F6|nr:O-antigen ligase family protein [Alkalibacillus filiformis]
MPLIYKSYFYITICLNVVLVYVTTSRAVWLALLVSLISFIVIKFYREKSKHLFGITIGTSFTLVFLYIQLEGTRLGDWLNDQSREHFSKNFFSGRSGLWAELWEAIMASPVIGHGVGVHARDITSYQLTSHNQFLQTMLESGFIGFVILIGLLLSLWLLLLKNLNHGVTVWSMSFFVGILVYQSLEMSLFINNTWFGLFQWLIICIGISFKDNYTKTDKNL